MLQRSFAGHEDHSITITHSLSYLILSHISLRTVHKGRPHKIAKKLNLSLLSEKYPHWFNLLVRANTT